MLGIILAGGFGTRLRPLTNVTNKHLLPVFNKPMIYYPIDTLKEMGITEVFIVTGEEHSDHFQSLLGNGSSFGMKFKYGFQKGAGGIADALKLAEEFANGDSIAVILGDNIFEANFYMDRKHFEESKWGARLFFKSVKDPERFGVPVFDDNGSVCKIEEKPILPKSSFAVTGLYFYDARVFDIAKKMKPSARGEMEITDVNNFYISDKSVSWSLVGGFWSDAGTFESLFVSSSWSRRKQSK